MVADAGAAGYGGIAVASCALALACVGGCAPPCTSTSVAAMRAAGVSGCYELKQVVLVARTSGSTAPRLFVQDPNGGDYSAIMAKCSVGSKHPCPAGALTTALTLLDGESVTLQGYYDYGAMSGFEELSIDTVIDNGVGLPLPPPVALQVADVARSARVPKQWFQKATVSASLGDPLVMYDFSPPEMSLKGPCPAWEGFGMIPQSAGTPQPSGCGTPADSDAGWTAGIDATAGSVFLSDAGAASSPPMSSPAGLITPDMKEVLIGRQFFHGFYYSTDCACASVNHQTLLTPSSAMQGTMTGILILEVKRATTTSFQVFEPMSKLDFPVL